MIRYLAKYLSWVKLMRHSCDLLAQGMNVKWDTRQRVSHHAVVGRESSRGFRSGAIRNIPEFTPGEEPRLSRLLVLLEVVLQHATGDVEGDLLLSLLLQVVKRVDTRLADDRAVFHTVGRSRVVRARRACSVNFAVSRSAGSS